MLHHLALVGDHHHPIGSGRHDLLAEQGAAAAFDQAKLVVDLVGAIDREIELRRLIERGERNSELLGLDARRLRTRHAEHAQAPGDPLPESGNEAGSCRAGTEPKPHAVLDQVKCGTGGLLLQLVGLEQALPPHIPRLQLRRRLPGRKLPCDRDGMLKDTTIVFDLDGTLVDTAPDLTHALNYALARAGQAPVSAETVRSLVGMGARVMIEEGLQRAGVTGDLESSAGGLLVNYEANIAVESRPFPGAVEALDRLRGEGARLAVCTNKRNLSRAGSCKSLSSKAISARSPGATHFPWRSLTPAVDGRNPHGGRRTLTRGHGGGQRRRCKDR